MLTTYPRLDQSLGALRRDVRSLGESRARPAERARRSAADIAAELGVVLDPWQRDAVATDKRHVLLLVTRQGGKGLVAALLALDELLNSPGSKVLAVSRSEDQAKRLLARIKAGFLSLADTPRVVVNRADELALITGSRAIAVPGSEETIRGIDAVDLLLIDEAAVVPDELESAVRPMLATTNGRRVYLSTPRGKRGFFYRTWVSDSRLWHRVKVTAAEIPRISPDFLADELHEMGRWMFDQEYGCEFLDAEDQLYPSDLIAAALSADVAPLGLPTFGGGQ